MNEIKNALTWHVPVIGIVLLCIGVGFIAPNVWYISIPQHSIAIVGSFVAGQWVRKLKIQDMLLFLLEWVIMILGIVCVVSPFT